MLAYSLSIGNGSHHKNTHRELYSMCAYVYVFIHMCECKCVYTYMHTCVYEHACVCVCGYIHIVCVFFLEKKTLKGNIFVKILFSFFKILSSTPLADM